VARGATGGLGSPEQGGAVVNPSEIAGLAAYPALLDLFQKHIDMQFADIRVLMRFPISLNSRRDSISQPHHASWRW
jgi:hypothetical protein